MIKYTIQIYGESYNSLDEARKAIETPNEFYKANAHRDSEGRNYIFASDPNENLKAQIYPNNSARINVGGVISNVEDFTEYINTFANIKANLKTSKKKSATSTPRK